MSSSARPTNRAAIVVVSIYLIVVGALLILTRQIPSPGFLRILSAMIRPKYSADVRHVTGEKGYCYVAPLPSRLLSDRDSSSRLTLFEDGRELGPGHAAHEDIRRIGQGRFSHWGSELYFSTSDNSDPSTNGRHYEVRERRQ